MLKRNVLLALAALLIAAGSAYAQSLKVKVPFQFTAHEVAFPAGSYWINSSYDLGSANVLTIEGLDRHTSPKEVLTSTPAESLDTQHQTKLVFHCYGASCFLSQVWIGNNLGRQLTEDRQERQFAKQGLAPRVPTIAAIRSGVQ
jgi:hypothetical protein